jgi:hypothetical protein
MSISIIVVTVIVIVIARHAFLRALQDRRRIVSTPSARGLGAEEDPSVLLAFAGFPQDFQPEA